MAKIQAKSLDELKKMFDQYTKDKGFLYADGMYRCNEKEQIYMDNDTCEHSIVDDWMQYLRENGYVCKCDGEGVDCGPSGNVCVMVIAVLLDGAIETMSFQLYPSDWWSEGIVYGNWNDKGEFIEES